MHPDALDTKPVHSSDVTSIFRIFRSLPRSASSLSINIGWPKSKLRNGTGKRMVPPHGASGPPLTHSVSIQGMNCFSSNSAMDCNESVGTATPPLNRRFRTGSITSKDQYTPRISSIASKDHYKPVYSKNSTMNSSSSYLSYSQRRKRSILDNPATNFITEKWFRFRVRSYQSLYKRPHPDSPMTSSFHSCSTQSPYFTSVFSQYNQHFSGSAIFYDNENTEDDDNADGNNGDNGNNILGSQDTMQHLLNAAEECAMDVSFSSKPFAAEVVQILPHQLSARISSSVEDNSFLKKRAMDQPNEDTMQTINSEVTLRNVCPNAEVAGGLGNCFTFRIPPRPESFNKTYCNIINNRLLRDLSSTLTASMLDRSISEMSSLTSHKLSLSSSFTSGYTTSTEYFRGRLLTRRVSGQGSSQHRHRRSFALEDIRCLNHFSDYKNFCNLNSEDEDCSSSGLGSAGDGSIPDTPRSPPEMMQARSDVSKTNYSSNEGLFEKIAYNSTLFRKHNSRRCSDITLKPLAGEGHCQNHNYCSKHGRVDTHANDYIDYGFWNCDCKTAECGKHESDTEQQHSSFDMRSTDGTISECDTSRLNSIDQTEVCHVSEGEVCNNTIDSAPCKSDLNMGDESDEELEKSITEVVSSILDLAAVDMETQSPEVYNSAIEHNSHNENNQQYNQGFVDVYESLSVSPFQSIPADQPSPLSVASSGAPDGRNLVNKHLERLRSGSNTMSSLDESSIDDELQDASLEPQLSSQYTASSMSFSQPGSGFGNGFHSNELENHIALPGGDSSSSEGSSVIQSPPANFNNYRCRQAEQQFFRNSRINNFTMNEQYWEYETLPLAVSKSGCASRCSYSSQRWKYKPGKTKRLPPIDIPRKGTDAARVVWASNSIGRNAKYSQSFHDFSAYRRGRDSGADDSDFANFPKESSSSGSTSLDSLNNFVPPRQPNFDNSIPVNDVGDSDDLANIEAAWNAEYNCSPESTLSQRQSRLARSVSCNSDDSDMSLASAPSACAPRPSSDELSYLLSDSQHSHAFLPAFKPLLVPRTRPVSPAKTFEDFGNVDDAMVYLRNEMAKIRSKDVELLKQLRELQRQIDLLRIDFIGTSEDEYGSGDDEFGSGADSDDNSDYEQPNILLPVPKCLQDVHES